MAVGVVADQMSFLLHTPYDIRMQFGMFSRDKKGGLYPPFLQAVQKLLRVSGVGAVVC